MSRSCSARPSRISKTDDLLGFSAIARQSAHFLAAACTHAATKYRQRECPFYDRLEQCFCVTVQYSMPMAQLGQSRHFEGLPTTSGLPSSTDIAGVPRHAANGPIGGIIKIIETGPICCDPSPPTCEVHSGRHRVLWPALVFLACETPVPSARMRSSLCAQLP